MRIPMMFRFSLYGFLKNQQYYEPFFILAFREKGLSFFQIGVLIGLRAVFTNLMELPTGTIADLYGRRQSMILSFIAYIGSFLMLGFCSSFNYLVVAMFFFAIGEAFRSGTHKAMIFTWLRTENRIKEKTKVYGFTRSWSKIGSAVSVLLSAGLVFYTGSYSGIFLFSIVPYLLNIANFIGYPSYLDDRKEGEISLARMTGLLWRTCAQAVRNVGLRRIYMESMAFEGVYEAAMNYLQPILKQAVLVLPLFLWMESERRTAILVGVVYFSLHILSSIASRRSHTLSDYLGGDEHAGRFLWRWNLSLFVCILFLLLFKMFLAAGIVFIGLSALQNLWRPALMSRLDEHTDSDAGATILSLEAQLKSVSLMILAPAMGFLVDKTGFWPVGALGLAVSMAVIATESRKAAPKLISLPIQPQQQEKIK